MTNDFNYSDVENIDYRKPHSEFDDAFDNLKNAAQLLADHKHGQAYTEKAEGYLRAALPLVKLVRTNEAAQQRLEMLASASKVNVRSHAQNRDILILFKLAQKAIGRAATAAERNKWATIAVRGVKEGWDSDKLIEKVHSLKGINNAAKAYYEPPLSIVEDENGGDNPPTVQIRLVIEGLGDDVEISGTIPADIAQSVAKRIKAALTLGGAE